MKEIPVKLYTGTLEILLKVKQRDEHRGFWCPKVLNFLNLKIKDVVIFAAFILQFSPLELYVSAKPVLHMEHSQITNICTRKICS